jgi:hypothetical protein
LKSWDWKENGDKQPKAIYPSLRTNLPHFLMQFRNEPFPNNQVQQWTGEIDSKLDRSMFPPHMLVKQYVKDCAMAWDVNKNIKFKQTVVDCIKQDGSYKLSIFDQTTKKTREKFFDFVWVANGHFSVPKLPELNYSDFRGELYHSQSYRYPDQVNEKVVLVVGASWSGQDLVREMSHYATKIYWSAKNPANVSIPLVAKKACISIVPQIQHFNTDGSIQLVNGSKVENVDIVFMATGYLYSFPFLPKFQSNIDSVPNLLLEMFDQEDFSLCFLGLPRNVLPFPTFEFQAECAAAYASGMITKEEIQLCHQEYLKIEARKCSDDIIGLPHDLGSGKEFLYYDLLADMYGGEKVPEWKRVLRSQLKELRIEALGY